MYKGVVFKFYYKILLSNILYGLWQDTLIVVLEIGVYLFVNSYKINVAANIKLEAAPGGTSPQSGIAG